MADSIIPVLDFSLFSTDIKDEDVEMGLMTFVSEHFIYAFQTTGFLFLKNSGLTKEEISAVNTVTSQFFHQPVEQKSQFARSLYGENHGWVAVEVSLPSHIRISCNRNICISRKLCVMKVVTNFELKVS